jgi:hypothetical protein
LSTLENGFVFKIKALRQNSQPIGLAERLKGMKTPEKIRIAVLDTGIDLTDKMLKPAGARIIEKRSWIGSPEDYVDRHGHGTHVTRLLLKIAPAAEIYVAKITEGKNVDPENMSGIAKVSLPFPETLERAHRIPVGYRLGRREVERAHHLHVLWFRGAKQSY